jgi:hypothetical protein
MKRPWVLSAWLLAGLLVTVATGVGVASASDDPYQDTYQWRRWYFDSWGYVVGVEGTDCEGHDLGQTPDSYATYRDYSYLCPREEREYP